MIQSPCPLHLFSDWKYSKHALLLLPLQTECVAQCSSHGRMMQSIFPLSSIYLAVHQWQRWGRLAVIYEDITTYVIQTGFMRKTPTTTESSTAGYNHFSFVYICMHTFCSDPSVWQHQIKHERSTICDILCTHSVWLTTSSTAQIGWLRAAVTHHVVLTVQEILHICTVCRQSECNGAYSSIFVPKIHFICCRWCKVSLLCECYF